MPDPIVVDAKDGVTGDTDDGAGAVDVCRADKGDILISC